MNPKKIIGFFLILLAVVLFAKTVVYAQDFVIGGNGAGSENSVNFQQNNNTNVQQSNTANVQNNVGANANTGGNSGGSITTGDATSNVSVTNQLNLNNAKVGGCCPDGKTPPPTPPTPPNDPGGNGGSGSGGGESSSGGGGSVLGLSATSGPEDLVKLFYVGGVLCLVAAKKLLYA